MTGSTQALSDHLEWLLLEGQAHVRFEQAVADMPFESMGERVAGSPHSAWHQLEHLRICQWDILEFSRDPQHTSPPHPEGYWPASDGPSTPDEWTRSVEDFMRDRQAMVDLVTDPAADLFAPFAWGEGQTLLREALLLADHNSYHLGQLVMVRRGVGAWPKE